MIETRDLRLPALEKQLEFLRATEREVLYSGAFGSGKTRAICMKLVQRASVPHAREGLCRKNYVALKSTTLKTLLEPEGDLPPVLPEGYYHYFPGEGRIRLTGGGDIILFGLDDPRKIGSLTLGGCAVDEATQLTEQDWTFLRGRLRLQVRNLSQQLYAACNPSGPSHFLAKRFGLAGGLKCAKNCKAVTTASADNSFLPKDYLADLSAFTGIWRARYVLGLWAASDRLIYDVWDAGVYAQSRPGPWKQTVCGVDVGYANPSAIIVVAMDGDGRLHVPEEWYEKKRLPSEVVEQVKALTEKYKLEKIIVDPSEAGVIAELQSQGMSAYGADARVMEGIAAVRERMRVGGDGRPLLTVDPGCGNLIREFETYETRAGHDDPVKQNDHAMDALRYAVMDLLGTSKIDLQRTWGDDAAVEQTAAVMAQVEGQAAGEVTREEAEDREDEELYRV